jgi:hypothetical protein
MGRVELTRSKTGCHVSVRLRRVFLTLTVKRLASTDAVKNAFIECLVGLRCMEKLKLKLQLEALWKYFTKIECEIMLIAARMELTGPFVFAIE